MKKLKFFFLTLLVSVSSFAQTGSDAKAKQIEQIRLLKQQQIEEQKLQNEWNNQASQQEIKKLNCSLKLNVIM